MRFLIVSPDENLRGRLAGALRDQGLYVEETRPEGATHKARPDRVIVDVARPSMPGGAVLTAVRDLTAAFPGVPVVVLAPFPSATLMRLALRLGAVDCIPRGERAEPVLAAFAEAEAPVELNPRGGAAFASLDEVRWQHIGRALDCARGNISGAARLLGIHRQSLQRILRSLRQGATAEIGAGDEGLEASAAQ